MILPVKARWQRCILVCRRCERKLDGGFGDTGKDRLSRLLRKQAGGKGRKARFGVISGPCLKLCPKGGVTVVDGSRPDRWLVVTERTPIEEVVLRLGLESGTSHASDPDQVPA